MIDVTQMAVNDQVPNAIFDFAVPNGSIDRGRDGKVIFFHPGGEDLMDLWAAWCISVSQPFGVRQRHAFLWPAVVTAASILFTLILAVKILRT